MISGLFFVNLKGEIIISRLYRDDVSVSAANAFRTQVRPGASEPGPAQCRTFTLPPRPTLQVIASKETGNSAPVRTIEGNTFLFTRMKDLFLVAVTRSNVNAGAWLGVAWRGGAAADQQAAAACCKGAGRPPTPHVYRLPAQVWCFSSCSRRWRSSRATLAGNSMRCAGTSTS